MTTALDRDTGFCSGGDDDEGFYSHTDASDDSADLKVRGASQLRNKRKCTEPRRLDTELPAKKRKLDIRDAKTSPFRPWSETPSPTPISVPAARSWSATPSPTPVPTPPVLPAPWAIQRPQEKTPYPLTIPKMVISSTPFVPAQSRLPIQQEEPLSLVSKKKESSPRRPANRTSNAQVKRGRSSSSETSFQMDSILSMVQEQSQSGPSKSKSSQAMPQRNYKNMTRERRIEANARERTRVHTISAAFDTLRSSIPAYSHNQKLSKLSVLRIACSYIVSLSRLADRDYSADQSNPDLAQCVDTVTRTIQTEGKVRKKKDE